MYLNQVCIHGLNKKTVSVSSIVSHIYSKKSLMSKIEHYHVHQLIVDFDCSKAQQYDFNSKLIESYLTLLQVCLLFRAFDMTFIQLRLNTNEGFNHEEYYALWKKMSIIRFRCCDQVHKYQSSFVQTTKAFISSIRLNTSYSLMTTRVGGFLLGSCKGYVISFILMFSLEGRSRTNWTVDLISMINWLLISNSSSDQRRRIFKH